MFNLCSCVSSELKACWRSMTFSIVVRWASAIASTRPIGHSDPQRICASNTDTSSFDNRDVFFDICWWWEVENINASYWWAKIRPINCSGLVKTPPWLFNLEGRRARWRPMRLTWSESLFEQLRLEWTVQPNFRVVNRTMSLTCRSTTFEMMHSRVSDAIFRRSEVCNYTEKINL